MDRVLLEGFLAEGLSLAEIGRRVGRHESTVAYWVGKHRLQAAHRSRHAPKGAIASGQLTGLVKDGLSSGEIARELGLSRTTVRHWLREYGLATVASRRRANSRDGVPSMCLRCRRHGETIFALQARGGYRCKRCLAEAVARRRRSIKRILIDEAGGSCRLCGYDRCVRALGFHHLAPSEKRFALSHRGVTRSLQKARAEASKCVLLCANCHAEVEAGVTTLAPQVGAEYNATRASADAG